MSEELYPIGRIVDKNVFVIEREIATGGMGSVYEALLYGVEGFQKTVAIKTIRKDFVSDKDFLEMFIGEAKLVADLVHQNIVQIYQLGKMGDRYYIAMEYVNGINLHKFMAKHKELGIKTPIDLGTFIISRICRGLEYAHSKCDKYGNLLNVVHRDISPKNIIISSEGEVKITDFGIAKARNLMKDREGEILLGKIQYMSPEQAQFKTTDKRSDLFSLGIVAYELLTGVNIFATDVEDTTKALENVITKNIPNPSKLNRDIPEALSNIIMKALERDITKRYQDASAMGYDLEYFMYHKGYGPTIVTLEKYLRKLFPQLYLPPLKNLEKKPLSNPSSQTEKSSLK